MAPISSPQHVNITRLERKISLPPGSDFATIDETIMDSEAIDRSASFHSQRDVAVDHGLAHSSATNNWLDYQCHSNHASVQQSHTRISSFGDRSSYHHFKPSDTPHSMLFNNQHGMWSLNEPSGSCTPTRSYTGPECESSTSLASFTNHLGQSSPIMLGHPLEHHGADVHPSSQASGVSPQLSKEWSSMSPSDQAGGDWSILSESHTDSSNYLGSIDVLRRDGIRKKNARFEIPAERNLQTIDKLISTTTDEQQIKELKQQKRLLRNRQAALDSRQRKKQHTERLEEEKKSFTSYINDLEEEIMALRLRDQEWAREKDSWAVSQQSCQQYIESLTIEKDEIIRNYTIETGELRKKNLLLADQIRRLESAAMSTAPSSTGFSTEFSEFDHTTVQSSPWENFSSINDFSMESEQPAEPIMCASPQPTKLTPKSDDMATTSSLFLLLLLCGAWVASRNPQTSSALPRMPDDVRMASATVLNHLYEDAGLESQSLGDISSHDYHSLDVSHNRRMQKIDFSDSSQLQESTLDSLHHHLTGTTEDQLREQAFSLTPSQYHGISTEATFDPPKLAFTRNRRRLQESLAALRHQNQANSVDSYSRSILWERVPKDIVKDFARLVAGNMNVPQWKADPGS